MNKNELQNATSENLWLPFTQMSDLDNEPSLIIESGSGIHLTDIDKNTYIDGCSSLWTNVHGHTHPKINAAIHSQVDVLAHSTLLGFSHPLAIQLAKRLVEITPNGCNHVFYSDSGSTATEIAVKMCLQARRQQGQEKRNRFLCLKNAYHGDTIGAVSVGGISLFHEIFRPLLFETLQTTAPNLYHHPLSPDPEAVLNSCIEELRKILQNNADTLCAMIVEPLVQGACGIYTYLPSYLKAVRELTKEFDVLLICDEVATGFGRTGKMFACEHENIEPDIICMAKGLSGGYLPLAATVATDEIFNAFHGEYETAKTFFHGHTYTGNPLACASALANLDIFEEEKTLQKLQPTIKHLTTRLATLAKHKNVGDIRQCGLMVGIELVEDKTTEKHTPFSWEQRVGAKVCLEARKHGLLIRPLEPTLVIMPPLITTPSDIDSIIDAVEISINTILP